MKYPSFLEFQTVMGFDINGVHFHEEFLQIVLILKGEGNI